MKKRFFTLRNGLSSCCHAAVNKYNKYNELLITREDYIPETEELTDVNAEKDFGLRDPLCSKNYDRIMSERIECSNCGKDVSVKLGSKYPHTVKDWEGVLVGSKFRPIVRLAKLESKYKQVKGDRIIRKEEKSFFSFNFKTGRLYQVILGGKPKKVVRDGITIANMMKNMCAKKHVVRFIAECIKARAIYLFPEVDLLEMFKFFNGTEDIFKLARKYNNRGLSVLFRILHQPDYAKIVHLGNMGCIPKKLRKKLAVAQNPSDALDVVFNQPGKLFKKYIFGLKEADKTQVAVYYLLNTFNRDRLQTLFNERKLWDEEKIIISHDMTMELGAAVPFSPKGQVYLKELKQFVKAYGEGRIINHLIENNTEKPRWGGTPSPFQYLGDSIDMYKQIMEKAPDYEFPRQASLKAVHDRLSVDNNKLRDPKQDIQYEEDELILNQDINGIKFKAAADTYELFDVGAAMNICVGGYGHGAVQKHYYIVIVYVEDKPLVCIQLAKNKHKNHKDTKDSVHDWFVNQAKLHNNTIAGRNADITKLIRMWMEKVNAIGRTYDIPMNTEEANAYNTQFFGDANPVPQEVINNIEPDEDVNFGAAMGI